MRRFNRLILAAGAALALAGPALAQKAALTPFLEPNHIITRYQHNEFAEKVRARTGGRTTGRLDPRSKTEPCPRRVDGAHEIGAADSVARHDGVQHGIVDQLGKRRLRIEGTRAAGLRAQGSVAHGI